jgi:hypothetical protein
VEEKMTDTRQRFQGLCLESDEGWVYMRDGYDRFSPAVRKRLRESPFNLCSACVYQQSSRFFAHEHNRDRRYFAAIEMMEEQIRAGN